MALKSINPATEEVIAEFDELTDEQVKTKIAKAQTAFESWRQTSFSDRAGLMKKVSQILRDNSKEYGEVVSQETGKLLAQSITFDVEKSAMAVDYYATNAEKFLTPEEVSTDASQSYVRFDPIGIVLAVMPWNFPFWQVFRFAAPALMAGNVAILKHASNVQLSASKIEEVFVKAGFPDGVFQNLAISSAKVEAIIRDPRIRAVTLTGSELAGKAVAKIAGEEIKKTVLELGGSDPFIILDDADVEQAAQTSIAARLNANGQSCICAKRFIVVESVAGEFLKIMKRKFEELKPGNPFESETTLGPLATRQGLEDIKRQVEESVAQGATVFTGGKVLDGKGYFYAPTILTDVKPGMPAYHEEFFGPVAIVIKVKNEAEALKVANDSDFGLGASVWTKDVKRGEHLAAQIDSGAVFINGMTKSDPRLPFGGQKRSGYGRELSSYGIKEFINIKTVWIK